MDNHTYKISSNTQLFVSNVGIGVAGILERNYINESGGQKRGMTAGLWIYDRTADVEGEKSFVIYINQTIRAYGYTIQVIDIDGSGKGSVTLRVVPDS